MSDPLTELAEAEAAPSWSYKAGLLTLDNQPEYYIPNGTKLIAVKDCDTMEEVYMTAHKPRIRGLGGQYPAVVLNKDPLRLSWGVPQAVISFFAPNLSEWLSIDVPHDYPLRTVTDDERERYERIRNRTKGNVVHASRFKLKGNKSGRGMMEAWGYYFEQFIRVPGGRARIIEEMCKEFPDRSDKVKRWVDAYKSYYNLGRLPGCRLQAKKLDWIASEVTVLDPLSSLLED